MQVNKSYFKSKTLWVGLLTILAPLFPEVEDVLKESPQAVTMLTGSVFFFLRLLTGSKLGK